MTARKRPAASPRALLDSAISEKAFQAQVIQLATLNGWLVYHTFDSRRSTPGYPDLTLVRNGCIIFAELKTERGRVSAAQRTWIAALSLVAGVVGASGVIGAVRVFLWKPGDWNTIERVLAGETQRHKRQGAA